MITLNHVQKQYGNKILFRDASLQIGVRDRVGLIGPNGSGKTSLFRMILREESIDEGEILIAKGVKMGYLPQEVISFKGNTVLDEVLKSLTNITSLQDKMKILEEELSSMEDPREQERLAREYGKLQERYTLLGGYGLEAEAKRILQGLGFKERDFDRLTDELSGGWRMRIALAKILLQSPDLLLLAPFHVLPGIQLVIARVDILQGVAAVLTGHGLLVGLRVPASGRGSRHQHHGSPRDGLRLVVLHHA